MKKNNKKTIEAILKKIGKTLAVILVVAVADLVYRFDQPGEVPPIVIQLSGDWEASVTSPDIQREHL